MGLPIPNLDDKTFEEIVQEARTLIAQYAPAWTDHNLHDPGITFVELFSWVAEMQLYQLNRITDAQYLKFLKLVGITPFHSRPAEAEIVFETVKNVWHIEAGTPIVTLIGSERLVFKTMEEQTLVPVTLRAVRSVQNADTTDHTAACGAEGIRFHPFGAEASPGSELRLGFAAPLPREEIRISFELFEGGLTPPGCQADRQSPPLPSAALAWEYLNGGTWNPLNLKRDTTAALNSSGSILFDAPASMDAQEGSCWIRCRIAGGRYEIVPQMERIRLNVVRALQIETMRDEALGMAREMPDQTVSLRNTPVIGGSQVIRVQDDAGHWETWEEVDGFESSGPDDPHYTFDPESGEITFGNGLNGRIPAASSAIAASVYETTREARGNVPGGQSFFIETPGFEGIRGINPKAATGGKAAESIEDAKVRARKIFRTPHRAVTAEDFEALALATPGLRVARAKALPNYDPDYPCLALPGTVTVVAVPCVRGERVAALPGERFLQAVRLHLEAHRLVTSRVHVIGPEYVDISVRCRVHIRKRSSPAAVERRVTEALERFLDPLQGGPDNSGWPFGRPVYRSEIYQLIDGVEGVDYASEVTIAVGEKEQEGDAVGIPPTGLVRSGGHLLAITERGEAR